MTWQPAFMKDITAWINRGSPADNSLWGMWDANDPGLSLSGSIQPGEGGVDLTAPQGTPVYALETGPVMATGSWNGNSGDPSGVNHQVLTQRVNVPGYGPQDIYYQHLYLNPGFAPGQVIQRGQQIGTVGSFGETEIGFNSQWGGIYGSNHPGPWVRDPRPMLAALLSNGASVPYTGSTGTSTNGASSGGLDWATQFHNEGIKIGIFLLAFILVGFGAYLLFQKQADGLIKKGVGVAAKVALV